MDLRTNLTHAVDIYNDLTSRSMLKLLRETVKNCAKVLNLAFHVVEHVLARFSLCNETTLQIEAVMQ